MTRWTALLLAGVRPGGDPFAAAHGVPAKALIPVGGMAMALRPLSALLASDSIRTIHVLTQRSGPIARVLPDDKRVSLVESRSTIAATLQDVLAQPTAPYPLLVTTADHALLDPEMIAEFCAAAAGADLAIGLVERGPLMKRLPQSKRTWIGFRGGAYSGANLFAIGSPKAARAIDLWRAVEQDRKKGWRLLAALGLPGLLGLLRVRTLHQTAMAVGRKLGLTIRPVEMSDPLAAVDVDKPADLLLVEAILEGRA
jgi:GTP:adenosylcobinamide-phosphate guanylyltransferase